MFELDVWYNGDYGMSFYNYGSELYPIGTYIGHSWRTFRLIPNVRPFFNPPSVKESDQASDSVNGKINTSNLLLGFPLYNDREGSFTFYIDRTSDYIEPEIRYSRSTLYDSSDPANPILDGNSEALNGASAGAIIPSSINTSKKFHDYIAKIHRALHGKHIAIILDEDPDYFYDCYIQVESDVASNDGRLLQIWRLKALIRICVVFQHPSKWVRCL